MSRAPSTSSAGTQRGARVAALHRQGAHWRLVIAEGAGAGPVRIVEAATISYGDADSVRRAMEAAGADRLIRIAPSASSVCRVVELPDAGGADLAAALALLAEAELPESIPAHRRGAGPLASAAPGGGTRALLVAWSGDSAEPPSGTGILPVSPDTSESWTAEPAALIGLLELAAKSGAPEGAAIVGDRESGSIGVAAAGAGRAVVRALREANEGVAWHERLKSRWNQTVAAAGITEPFPTDGDNSPFALLVSESARAALTDAVSGVRPDALWLADYGVALGAACLALRTGAGAGGLCGMTPAPVVPRRSRLERISLALARPTTAVKVIAACLALALLGPLAAQWLRHAVLVSRSGGLQEQQAAERGQMMLVAFYQQLDRKRWPMTKILADLSGALPVGVTAESVRFEPGQRISVRGRSDSLELVNQLQSRLNESGVFVEVTIDRTQSSDEGALEFDLSGRVVQPFAQAKGLEDFSTNTLARRLYGERADLIPAADTGAAPAPSGRSGQREAATPARSRAEPQGATTTARAAEPPPAALTDELIAAMDANTAMKEWTSRLRASKQPGLDETTKQRLAEEAEKCRARMQAARQQGASQ